MTYYEILEISEKASQEVIHMAYKALCKKYHPDVYQGDKHFAEEQIKKINEAYEILSDETQKKNYDNSLKNPQKHSNNDTEVVVSALLKRGFIALEDGEWLAADGFFEKCLNQNAELGEAYLGKLMVELRICRKEELRNCKNPFDDSNYYEKAVRFADDNLKSFLIDTIQYIKNRNFEEECSIIYNQAIELMEHDNCIESLESAMSSFQKISQYKDSLIKIKECEDLITELKVKIAKEEREREEYQKKSIKMKCIFGSLAIIVLTVGIVLSISITNKDRYNQSLEFIESKKYVEAISVLEKIKNYKNSKDLLEETRYAYAMQLFDNKEFAKAKEEFSKLDYKDSKNYITLCVEQINEGNYQKALLLIKENKIIDGYNLLNELSEVGYKDSKTLLENLKVSYDRALFNEKLKTLDFGSVVTFGSYEQDDNLENGTEPVEWIIIDRNENASMLISSNIIEIQKFEDDYGDTTWETSSLRKWLNGTFYNNAFSNYEKQCIAETLVIPDEKEYSTSPSQGNETVDKVYLLSETEYQRYRLINGVENTISTKHAIALNGRTQPDGWWLRSTSDDNTWGINFVYIETNNVSDTWRTFTSGIRPVVWIKFE